MIFTTHFNIYGVSYCQMEKGKRPNKHVVEIIIQMVEVEKRVVVRKVVVMVFVHFNINTFIMMENTVRTASEQVEEEVSWDKLVKEEKVVILLI